jgi:starch synthase
MPQGVKYKVLMAASEVADFAKTGGLADVAAALPRALAERGHDCIILLPLYRCTRSARAPLTPTEHTFTIPLGKQSMAGRLWRSTLPDSGVPVYLVEQADYFERDDPAQGRGLYQYTLPGGAKRDYTDNCARFVFFSRAVLEAVRLLDFWPDVLHANDWQTGLIPVYVREEHGKILPLALRGRYQGIRSLVTIHNLAFQGVFWHWDMALAGLPWRLFNSQQLEFYGQLNFLKGGIVFADLINTVSPTYAREIQTPYFGCGLQGVLSARRDRLSGIVNGVDYRTWDPATDPHLAANYDAGSVAGGKPLCKAALQRRFGLDEAPRTPLLGVVSRLADQKGIDLVVKAADPLLRQDTQLVVLGEGDPALHQLLQELRARYPTRVGIALTQDEVLAHQIYAGADLFLMPSRYEPCGLSQLYSLRYGTVPVVRATGGLADTVVDATADALAKGTATGFAFLAETAAALGETVERALAMYRQTPPQWLSLQQTGMRQDWSWQRSAAEYELLYSKMRKPLQSSPGGK